MVDKTRIEYRNPETPESIRQDFSEGWAIGLVVVAAAVGLLVMVLVSFSTIGHG